MSDQLAQIDSLRQIADLRVRNLVRGFLSASNYSTARTTMERLRRTSSVEDARAAFRALAHRRLPDGHNRPTPFPRDISQVDSVPFYSGTPFEIELVAQQVNLNSVAGETAAAVTLLGKLSQAALSKDEAQTSVLFSEYAERYGLSLSVAFKALSLRHLAAAHRGNLKDYEDAVGPLLSPRRQVVAVAMEDAVDRERDYLNVRRSFLDFAAKGRLSVPDAAVVREIFSPMFRPFDYAADALQAYSRWGAVDSVCYLFRLKQVAMQLGSAEIASAIDAAVPSEVHQAWLAGPATMSSSNVAPLFPIEDEFFDFNFYSHSAAWSEIGDVMKYRCSIETAVGARLDRRFPITSRPSVGLATPVKGAADLLKSDNFSFNLATIDPSTSGAFHRTIALIASIEAGCLEIEAGPELARVLDQTIDVASLLSFEELKTLFPPRRSDLLYGFLRSALLNDASENAVNQHGMRRTLQELVCKEHGGRIVDFIQSVDTAHGHVSGYLYNLLTEAFLTELYDLYERADDVIDAQAAILEWRAGRLDDQDALARARSHRLTLRLRQVRGAIEETRIYVDPLRFLHWMQEQMGRELRALSAQIDQITSDSDRSLSLNDPVRVAVLPRLRLLHVLDQCYSEFCNNKLYGVTSFVGRRIRHGTLHGHLVLETAKEIQSVASEFRSSVPKFSAYLDKWHADLDTAVSTMASEQFHVRSKDKPKGLIVGSIDDPEKASLAVAMLDEVAASLKGQPQIAKSAAIILEYCWLLFEVDLKRARAAVENLRREFLIGVDLYRSHDRDVDRRISESVRALNTSMHQRFETVQHWLTRPSNVSPSASIALLFEAVLSEVKQRYPLFQPSVSTEGNAEMDLIGHRFHLFYDALYILVDNAAKHGRSDGGLSILVSQPRLGPRHTEITVSVKSDLPTRDISECVNRIDLAMSADAGDAFLRDRGSGIGKLRGLVQDVEEIRNFQHSYDGGSVIFSIDMRYVRS